MTNNVNHIKNQPELNREILDMISGSNIAWNKTKEEIWPEMLGKIEGNGSATRNTKTIYSQIVKYAAAAVFVLSIGISASMYFYTKTIATPLAQQTELTLPDNSKVMVYAQSVLSYKPLLWKFARTVKFEGEGFFEVQKGKKFEVVSKKGKTVVLGTQFDIYSRANDYKVTCVSGKVKVKEWAHQNEVIITGGQKAILKPGGNFEIQEKTNTQLETSNKSQTQTLEEELNTVLSTTPAQARPANKEHNLVPANKQATVKEQAAKVEQNKAGEQNAIKEQNRSQNQAVEDVQNKEQPKTSTQAQTVNKEQSLNQNQEKAKDQSSGNQQNKDKFRASLTPEQISILENKQMSKDEKKKAFLQSLSPEQRQLLNEQNKERAQQTEGNKKESIESDKMKEQQKMQMREQVRESTGKESKEQQKQQNQENKGNAKPGSENRSGSGNGNGS